MGPFLCSYRTFVNITKLQARVLSGRTSRSFLWCWLLLYYPHWRFLRFCVTFRCPEQFVQASQAWKLPPALSCDRTNFGCFNFVILFPHIFTATATVLSGNFLPTGVFYLALLSHHLARFATLMREGTHHPGTSFVPVLTELSLSADASPWTTHIVDTRPLVYRLHKLATKYRVKTKLHNMFQPTYSCSNSYGKNINVLWTRLPKKYCFLEKLLINDTSIHPSYF